MNYSNPHNLERWAFLWSQARLVIAAIALFIGGIPPIFLILPGGSLTMLILKACWIISGIAALYLAYRWIAGGRRLFGHRNTKDLLAFAVLVLSGLNLGIVGLLGNNIGMSILSGRVVFFITAVVYLAVAIYLYKRWDASGKRMF